MNAVINRLTDVDEIYKTIQLFDSDIVPAMSERGLNLKEYAQRLFNFAIVYRLIYENQENGFVVFYANDTVNKTAYLAQIAVKPQVVNKGFGYMLLKVAMETSLEEGMKLMKLEVYKQNHTAIAFYKRQGFTFCKDESDEFCYMQKEL